MDNLVLLKESKKLINLAEKLGFTKTLFLDKDFVLIEGKTKKEILKGIKEGKKGKKLVVIKVFSEELLRFVLEKTEADLIFGQELINPEDSVHFRRGGLDQITCKIAARRKKTLAFSFSAILNGKERSKLIGRIMLNIKLCKKYKVNYFLGNFSEKEGEMRGKHDLVAFKAVLESWSKR